MRLKGDKMSYDECPGCREKKTENEFIQTQLDDIRKTVNHYYNKRDHWEWDNLIDEIMGILER